MKNTIYTAESYGEFMKEQLISFETAKLAKEKGAYVIGISEEPEKLRCNSIDKLMKKPVDINELKKIFHNINERGYK